MYDEDSDTSIEVMNNVTCPAIGGEPVSGPYLFLGAVGLPEDKRWGYQVIQACAQPIVSISCPVPVDSEYERQAAGTLKRTLEILQRRFPEAVFELEKPVFEIDTEAGPCRPDFIITARRGGDERKFVVEVMGFQRIEYTLAKEVTHPRMKTLGTLCEMQAGNFGTEGGVTAEGKKVTDTIREALLARWSNQIRGRQVKRIRL